MTDIFDYIVKEWVKLSEAPLLFILVFLLAYYVSRWRYLRIIDILSIKNDQKETEIENLQHQELLNLEGVRIFDPPQDGSYNHDFYNYFTKKIREATEIYITGDGFSCINAEGEALARAFIESYRIALEKGATIRHLS